MSLRDTVVQLGFVMIAVGASYATWALLTGPLARYTGLGPKRPTRRRAPKPDPEDPPQA